MSKIMFNTGGLDEAEDRPVRSYEPGEYKFQVGMVKLQYETSSGVWGDEDVLTDLEKTSNEESDVLRQRIKLVLDVVPASDTFSIDNSFKVYDTLWLTVKAAWKYKQFCESLKLDSKENLDTELFWERDGLVYLSRKNDDKYLTPRKYLTELGQYTPSEKPSQGSPVEEPPF